MTVVVLSFVLFLLLSGCEERFPGSSESLGEPSFTLVNDFQIPIFSTPAEQLNYTRSWFAGIQERRASLQAFLRLYPQEKRYCGLASLDLAFLQLGSDYRLSYKYSSFAAIKAYKTILGNYSEFPGIMAKAHWYIGWIYSDLLKDREKGVVEYHKILKNYPDERVTLLPPVPWVSIIKEPDTDMNTTLLKRPVNKWAALALVEIIRYSGNEEVAWKAFLQLWQNYREYVVTGFGLRLILQKRYHTTQSLKMAREYLENEFSNVHILGDIQKEINAITGSESGMVR